MVRLREKIKNFYQTNQPGILLVLVLIVLGIASYQIYQYKLLKKESAKIQSAASSWQILEDKEQKFSLSFPGQPEKSEGTTSIEQIEVETLSYRSLLDNGTVYSLYFLSYPESVDLSDFDKNAKRMLKAMFNTQEKTQIVTIQKQITEDNPVLDVILSDQNGNSLNYHFILVGRNFYILSTAAAQGKTAESEKFFSSFKLIANQEG